MEKFEWKTVHPSQVPWCDYNLDISSHLLPFSANCELIILTGLWSTLWHTPGPATQHQDILGLGLYNGFLCHTRLLPSVPMVKVTCTRRPLQQRSHWCPSWVWHGRGGNILLIVSLLFSFIKINVTHKEISSDYSQPNETSISYHIKYQL